MWLYPRTSATTGLQSSTASDLTWRWTSIQPTMSIQETTSSSRFLDQSSSPTKLSVKVLAIGSQDLWNATSLETWLLLMWVLVSQAGIGDLNQADTSFRIRYLAALRCQSCCPTSRRHLPCDQVMAHWCTSFTLLTATRLKAKRLS